MTPYILGVDGGNTKTIALITQPDGRIVGYGRAGCGDIYGAGSPEAAMEQISLAVTGALTVANLPAKDLAVSVFSLAGADWPEDFALLQTMLLDAGFGKHIYIVNDAMGALKAGSPDGTGVVIVAGTGAASGARSRDGRIWHHSFWQEPGASLELSHKALRAVYRAELGVGESTSLTIRVLEFFGAESVESLLHTFTARGAQPSRKIDKFTPVLLDEANNGDSVARRIVEAQGQALADYGLAAARRVGIENTPFTLVLAGSVLKHPGSLLRDSIIARIKAANPAVKPIISRFEPAVGALLLSLEAAGVVTDESLRAAIEASLPRTDLFTT